MRVLQLVCTDCGSRFASGVPFLGEHLAGVKLRALEVCPSCGRAGEYAAEDYQEPAEGPVRAGGSLREDAGGSPPADVGGSPRAEADGASGEEALGPPPATLEEPRFGGPPRRRDAATGERG